MRGKWAQKPAAPDGEAEMEKSMQNGYFKLVGTSEGFGIRLFPCLEGGEPVRILELVNYLERDHIPYVLETLKAAVDKNEDTVVFLGTGECPSYAESYSLDVTEDNMRAVARFYPASDTGERISFDEFYKDLRYCGVKFGVQMSELQEHFQSEGIYCTDIEVAKGKAPRHGTDAKIEYFFNTDVHARPEMKEDGSVDFFNLNVINHCKQGDVLAKITPEDVGEPGTTIKGERVKPRDVKKAAFKFGKNILISEDKLTLTSGVNGHVTLVEDTVFVSDVYEVENVDTATGNIDFTGSVQVNGNVATNFRIKAEGNVVVKGVVEGAYIEAGGNIIIARGMNGMSRGILKAGGNIVAKFLENATAEAEGYVHAESILHSQVSAGTEIIVSGKKGFVTGGHVQADQKVEAKTFGAAMGASTIVEVGVNPKIKARYQQLQKEISEIVRILKEKQPVIANFMEKRTKGVKFNESQLKYIKETAQVIEAKKAELETANAELRELQKYFDPQKKAVIVVTGEVYPGTTLVIGDVSMTVQSSYKYCRFEKVDGDVKMKPM